MRVRKGEHFHDVQASKKAKIDDEAARKEQRTTLGASIVLKKSYPISHWLDKEMSLH
jgi:hypothetical protein